MELEIEPTMACVKSVMTRQQVAAHKAWVTIRAKKHAALSPAQKAWVTRRANKKQ